MSQYTSIKEAAEILVESGLQKNYVSSRTAIIRVAQTGQVKAEKTSGRWLINRASLYRYIRIKKQIVALEQEIIEA